VRPPGSLPEAEFVSTCIVCQECVRVCPTNGLQPAFLEAGIGAVGTPYLAPRKGGCLLNRSCPNLCAKVCPVGAIVEIDQAKMRVGLAKVERDRCLAWAQGVKCLVCVEACPTDAATPHQGRVFVNPQKCSGCGICEQACPVVDSAIHVTLEQEVRV
jgi:ferredoxin